MARKSVRERLIRLVLPPEGVGVGVFSIHEKNKDAFYTFREIPCDIGGRGFAVHRMGLGELYHVRIGAAAECSCECLGFLAHGRCKHVVGLLALVRQGVL